jgi:vacuolar protein sorting-associated protein 13A/C
LEYNVDDNQSETEHASTNRDDIFFEASDGTSEVNPELRQHIFELDFAVDDLRASISRSGSDGGEKSLGYVTLQHFRLGLVLLKYNLTVDVNLRALIMNIVQADKDPIQLISSDYADDGDEDLLSVSYLRVQRNSPEFSTVYDNIEQSVDVRLSTFIFNAAPEPVISLYDFLMTTFVPQGTSATVQSLEPADVTGIRPRSTSTTRIAVKLDSIQAWRLSHCQRLLFSWF